MNYQLLPFRFARFDNDKYLLSNDVGEYIFLRNDEFSQFVNGVLSPTGDLFYDIASKQIATVDLFFKATPILFTPAYSINPVWIFKIVYS